MKPELTYYPKWLRKYICYDYLSCGGDAIFDLKDSEENLAEVYSQSKNDPIASVVFWAVIAGIRNKFKIYDLEKEIEQMRSEINELKKTRKHIKSKPNQR